MIVLLIVIGVIVFGAGLALFLVRNQRHHEPGVASFQRRIDALSPEARRQSLDRIRPEADRDRKSRH